MDRYLKERLVGAAVLVAAAIILIPEMLSGPSDSRTDESGTPLPVAATTDANGVKTYTIDLSKPPQGGAQSNEASAPSAAPEVEIALAPPPEAAVTETPAAPIATTPSSSAQPDVQPEARSAPEPAPKPQLESPSKPATTTAPTSAPIATGAWVVQVASLSSRPAADRLANDLKAKGFAAFVAPFESKGQTLYRVRVGPVVNRADADALLKKIKPLHSNAAVAKS